MLQIFGRVSYNNKTLILINEKIIHSKLSTCVEYACCSPETNAHATRIESFCYRHNRNYNSSLWIHVMYVFTTKQNSKHPGINTTASSSPQRIPHIRSFSQQNKKVLNFISFLRMNKKRSIKIETLKHF